MKARNIALLLGAILISGCSERSTPTSPAATGPAMDAQIAAAPQDELVRTPAGYYHRSCVYEVPNGARVSRTGEVTRLDGTSYAFAQCLYPGRRSATGARLQLPTNTGWIEYAYETLGEPFGDLSARWDVPASPAGSYSGTKVYYTFPGLQEDYIIQPVIQYGDNGLFGGSYWRAASWHCMDASHCSYSTPITVYPGDEMLGSITASDCDADECSWTIITRDLTRQMQSTYVVTDTRYYQWATGGAVEVYDLTACNQYPQTGVFYNSIVLHDQDAQTVTPTWTNSVAQDLDPECDFSVTSTASSVSLYHNPPPPPPLIAGIEGSWTPPLNTDCTWEADASGGTPPYTYRWYRDEEFVSPVSTYSGNTGTSDFLLTLEVTDAADDFDDYELLVDVQSGGSCTYYLREQSTNGKTVRR